MPKAHIHKRLCDVGRVGASRRPIPIVCGRRGGRRGEGRGINEAHSDRAICSVCLAVRFVRVLPAEEGAREMDDGCKGIQGRREREEMCIIFDSGRRRGSAKEN